MNIVALDIGGTSIKSGLFSNDLLLESFDNQTFGNKGLEKIKESICIAINHYLGKRKIDCIAISTAGDIDPFKGEVVYASDNLNIHRSNIILCCQGIYKSTHGFIFKYAD